MKRILLITLSIILVLAAVLVIIKVTGTDLQGRPTDSISADQSDDVFFGSGDDISPVVDDYEIELQEDEFVEFK